MIKFQIERRYLSAYGCLRWCIVRGNEIMCHRDRWSDCFQMLSEIEKLKSFIPSVAIREGFHGEHFRRVIEAREWRL